MKVTIERWREAFDAASEAGLMGPGHEELYRPAVEAMSQEDFDLAVDSDPYCDIEPAFMGFAEPYLKALELAGPDDVVVDLGCCHGFASYAFEGRCAAYIGVDIRGHMVAPHGHATFRPGTSIEAFLDGEGATLDPGRTLVVLSSVPCAEETTGRACAMFPRHVGYYPGKGWF